MSHENRTASMLQRVPVILAVTAGSYGLSLQGPAARPDRERACKGRPHGRPVAAAASKEAPSR